MYYMETGRSREEKIVKKGKEVFDMQNAFTMSTENKNKKGAAIFDDKDTFGIIKSILNLKKR